MYFNILNIAVKDYKMFKVFNALNHWMRFWYFQAGRLREKVVQLCRVNNIRK